MKKFFISILFLSLSFTSVYAFTYSSYIDLYSLPPSEDVEDSITYDVREVDNNENIVKAPPTSEVVFGIEGDFQNNDTVGVRIFLSKDNVYQGDLTRILDIELPFEEFSFIKNGATKWRYGRMYSLENTTLGYGKTPLLTVSISQPLKVLEYSYDIQEGVVNVRTVVKNTSDKVLEYVQYTHGEFSLTKDFSVEEEYTYEYVLEYDNTGEYADLGFPRIFDPNSRYLCAAGTNTAGNPYNIFLIENGIIYYDTGTTLQDDFCIEQLGYTLNLGRIEVEKMQEETEEEGEEENSSNSNSNEETEDFSKEDIISKEEVGEILGIDILPKTVVDMYGYLFLGILFVAFGILIYYFYGGGCLKNR